MPILQIRDQNGNFIPIDAIRGDSGKSAYEQAKEGGYVGTEEEFIALLNGLTNTEDAAHYSDFSNPHNTTAEQTGAIPEEYYQSNNLNTEIVYGGGRMTVCYYHSGTLNTPYSEGLTVFAHGMVITNAYDSQYGTQLCLPSGEDAIYVRRINGGGISKWVKIANVEQLNAHIADTTKHAVISDSDGVSVGKNASAKYGGGAVGDGASAKGGGGAVGNSAGAYMGGAVGAGAYVFDGGAVGRGAVAGQGFSGGRDASTKVVNGDTTTYVDAIQLGTGTNPNERTLQVYNYPLMDALGNIVPDRLPTASGSYKGTNTYGTNKPSTLTFDFVPKIVIVSQRGERNATGGGTFIWINAGSTLNFINNGSTYWVHPTLEGTTLSWYCAESASYQLNSSSYTYDYFAWG